LWVTVRQDEQSCYQKGEIITVDQGLNRGARVVYLHDHDTDGITFEFIEKLT